MKKQFFIPLAFTLFAIVPIVQYAQVMGYNDLGIIFSSDTYRQGTARSMSMQHAFGALGGDLSALDINPASAAVFTTSKFSITAGNRQNHTEAEYNGSTTLSDAGYFNLAQAGGVLVFNDDAGSQSGWNRISIGINVSKNGFFDNEWRAKGTGNPTWIYDPADDNILYDHNIYQKYSSFTEGNHSVGNFTLSARYKNNYYFGFSVNSHSIEYDEGAILRELNDDGNGNTVEAYQKYWVNTRADGISFSAGMIAKTDAGLRFGLSYRSPVWYELTESSNMFLEDDEDYEPGYYLVTYSNSGESYYNNINKQLDYDYRMTTPGRITGSIAYVFDKKGLISFDISRKNYASIRIKPSEEFEPENEAFASGLVNVYQFRGGTEWKIDNISLRAGAGYENSPFDNARDSDHLFAYSLGAGYKMGALQFDIAYDHKEKTGYFDFYPQYDDLPGTELSLKTDHIVFTLGYSF